MSVDISDGLAAYIATQGSARAALTGGLLLIFGGEIAESANAAQSASLLWTVSVDGTGTGLSFEASPVGRALVKAEAETWSGPTSAGVATHWRLVGPGDDGSADPDSHRIQGDIGTTVGFDMFMGDTTLIDNANANAKIVTAFSWAIPAMV